MQRTPSDSLDPNDGSIETRRSSSRQGSNASSGPTSPRFPIARLEATDRAEWKSKTVGRSFANDNPHNYPNDSATQAETTATANDSPTSSAPSTPTTALPTSRTYHSLNYAPRQRTSVLRPNAASIFQSHSSQFSQQQQAALSTAGLGSPAQLSSGTLPAARKPANPAHASPLTAISHLSSSPSYPTISLPDAAPSRDTSRVRGNAISEADTARVAMVRMQLQQMQDEARRLGLNDKSAGWLILEALQAATEGEWAAVADLLANGDATLLLPRDPPSVFTSASQLSASFAYDHTIFNASSSSASRPTPAALSGLSSTESAEALPVLTLSGLRGSLTRTSASSDGTAASKQGHDQELDTDHASDSDRFNLTLQTFVVRTSQSSMSNLKDAASRQDILEALAPLPNLAERQQPRCQYPTFSLSASHAHFPLPSPLNTRSLQGDDQAGGRNRSRSNSKLNAAGSRASASFASIFGGSARERRRQATAEMAGSEMVDAQRLSVHAAYLEPRSSHTAAASQEVGDTQSGTQTPSSLGLDLREAAPTEPSEDLASAKEQKVERSRRTISVWVIDHLVRRSAVMRAIRKTLDARVKTRLTAAGIEDPIAEVVASFAATYLPPVPLLNDSSSSSSSSTKAGGTDRASSPIHVAHPPYLADPDDMSDNFQDFFNSVRDQLYRKDASAAQHDSIDVQLETVETVLCEEVYDRIFCPTTSRDAYHDDALASRIAALNVLGLSLRHLGLDVPSAKIDGEGQEAERSNALLAGLESIVQRCGAELQRLESSACRSPHAKLDVLVRAHKLAVDGVAELPSIKMCDEDDEATPKPSAPSLGQKGGDSTSADLILPLLIYSIVSSNPSRLASHLLYIERFRAESLVHGETSYCLVNVQAAVAFLENVDVKDLGLDSSQIGAHLRVVAPATGVESASRPGGEVAARPGASPATLAMPARIRGRLTQEIGDLAGASNKVITGVMGSSISAFSRMMGANAAANDAAGADAAASAPRPVRARSSSSTAAAAATDYSRADEQAKDRDMASTPTGMADKPGIGDRLASLSMLGRLGTSALSSSPSSSLGQGLPPNPNEGGGTGGVPAPGTTPPSRPAVQGRTTSYLAAQLGRITAPRSASASSTWLAPDTTETTETTKPLPASLQSPYPALSRPPAAERPLHVVLASTGSVASVKIPLIVESLLRHANVRIQVIATDNSLHFYDRASIAQLNTLYTPGQPQEAYTVASLAAENLAASRGLPCALSTLPRVHLWTNADEWSTFTRVGDPILHIELRRWADIVLVAPCSANTLAKLNAGMCDDLVTSFMRALGREQTVVVCPAMNTLMWLHPLTEQHVRTVRHVLGYDVLGPVQKRLACGDMGIGAMAEWSDIVDLVKEKFGLVRQTKAEKGG